MNDMDEDDKPLAKELVQRYNTARANNKENLVVMLAAKHQLVQMRRTQRRIVGAYAGRPRGYGASARASGACVGTAFDGLHSLVRAYGFLTCAPTQA